MNLAALYDSDDMQILGGGLAWSFLERVFPSDSFMRPGHWMLLINKIRTCSGF